MSVVTAMLFWGVTTAWGALPMTSQQPVNDNYADATSIAGESVDVSGDTTYATGEGDDGVSDATVWFKWTAPADRGVELDACSHSSSTRWTEVYTGATFAQREAVHPLEYRCENFFYAKQSVTYWISVDGAFGHREPFDLSLRASPIPGNDDFTNSTTLVGPSSTMTGTNLGAGAEPGEPDFTYVDDATVWYSWAPLSTKRRVSIGACPQDPHSYTWAAAFTGNSVSSLSPVISTGGGCANPLTFQPVAGTTYRIAVHGSVEKRSGDFRLETNTLVPPANDDFASATVLSGVQDQASGDLRNGTAEPGEPLQRRGDSVWYQWTAPVTRRVEVRTCDDTQPANYNAKTMDIYTGNSLGSLTSIGYGLCTLDFAAEAGSTYRFRVYSDDSNSHPSEFVLRLVTSQLVDTAIDSGPGAFFAGQDATFTYSAVDPNLLDHFECQLDGGLFAGCSVDGNTYPAIGAGDHRFAVRAVDPSGVADPSPAVQDFTIQKVPVVDFPAGMDDSSPATSIGRVPHRISAKGNVVIPLFASEPGAHFQCSLDGTPFTRCSSPVTVRGLRPGRHLFRARAVDAAGNRDRTAAITALVVERKHTKPHRKRGHR